MFTKAAQAHALEASLASPEGQAGLRRLTDKLWNEKHPATANGITSEDVIRHMKAKHQVNPQVIPTNLPGIKAGTGYSKDTDGLLRQQLIKKLSKLEQGSGLRSKLPVRGREGKLELLKHLRQQPKGDFITTDAQLLRKNPAVIGRELGRAANHTTEPGAKFTSDARSIRAEALNKGLLLGGGIAAMSTGNPSFATPGVTLSALRRGIALGDDREADRKADEALSELGHSPHSDALRRRRLLSLIPAGMAGTAGRASRASRASVARQGGA